MPYLLNLQYSQVGQSLPYKALGFKKVAALLESIPDVCSLQQRGGALMVVGVASRDTAHVLNMVNRQGKKQVVSLVKHFQ